MNKNRISLLVGCWIFCSVLALNAAPAPSVKYWVNFKNKTGTPFTISNPSAFLSAASIARRTAQNIAIHPSDLPVTPTYISQVENVSGVKVLYVSKWLNGVVVAIDSAAVAPAALTAISNFTFVQNTAKVNRYKVNIPEPKALLEDTSTPEARGTAADTSNGYNFGRSYWQNKQLNVDCYHGKGYRGQGMTIAVLDVGFISVESSPVFDSLRKGGGILGTRNFVTGDNNAYQGGSHGTMVLSCMAGNKPGIVLGSAPKAKYWLLVTENGATETISEEYNWIRGAEFADSVGVDILTTSLAYNEFDDPTQNHTYATLNGRTAPMSIAATMAARKGLFVLNAAGNEGGNPWHYIAVPADADSICTVGAVDSVGAVTGFSSWGPTSDGRIKPDLVARGGNTWVCDQPNVCFPGNGTSFATPVLAGAVACFWQANRNLTAMKVLDSLKKLGTNSLSPNNAMGWGLPKMPCVRTCNLKASFNVDLYEDKSVRFTSTSVITNSLSAFTWYFGDGTSGTGQSVVHTYTNTFKSTYQAYLKVDNQLSVPCSDTTPFKQIKFDLTFGFEAFSDPVTDIITIQLTEATYENISIEIYDLMGHVLLTGAMQPNDTLIQLNGSALADAIYLVKVKTSKGSSLKKILKR